MDRIVTNYSKTKFEPEKAEIDVRFLGSGLIISFKTAIMPFILVLHK
jgi:hypothetical protein